MFQRRKYNTYFNTYNIFCEIFINNAVNELKIPALLCPAPDRIAKPGGRKTWSGGQYQSVNRIVNKYFTIYVLCIKICIIFAPLKHNIL